MISSFDDYLSRRREFTVEHPADNARQEISLECEQEMWAGFQQQHSAQEAQEQDNELSWDAKNENIVSH